MPQHFVDTPAADMKAFKVEELTGHALDCAVEMALGRQLAYRPHYLAAAGVTLKQALWGGGSIVDPERAQYAPLMRLDAVKDHSSDWVEGGKGIGAERIMFSAIDDQRVTAYFARSGTSGPSMPGDNHLEAAARLRAFAVLGPEVSLPVVLVELGRTVAA